jgi:hypothetical protein
MVMKKQTKNVVLGAGVVVAIVGSMTLWLGMTAANAVERRTAEESFRAFEATPVSASLPDAEMENLGQSGLDAASLRALGRFQSVDFYLARDNTGNVCLVSWEKSTAVGGSSCSPPSTVAEAPLGLSVWNVDTGGFDAFLVSDTFASADTPRDWARVSGNLLVIDSDTRTEAVTKLEGRGGAIMELHRSQRAETVNGAPREASR